MRLSFRMAANLFEAAEANGVPRAALTEPLGLDPARLVDPREGIDWDTLVAILDRLSGLVGGVEGLRRVGVAMATVPSFTVLQRVGRAVLSVRSLYLAGERWVGAANVPHLVTRTTFPEPDRTAFRCVVPEPYAPSAPYLHIFEGLLCAVPSIIGLPPATILRTKVTPRELDILLAHPRSRSLLERATRIVRAAVNAEDVLALLEAQRMEIVEGLEATKRSTAEIAALFDRLPDLVVVHRGDRVAWANRAAVRMLGHEDEDALVGRSLGTLFGEGSRELAAERGAGVVDEGAPDLVEAELVAKDGSRVLVELSPAQTVSFGGREASLLVARDITEQRRLRDQLAIADRLAGVGMLAAGIAHEVNNPLAYVLNNIEIARRELRDQQDVATSRAALGVALEGVGRIRKIIRELLTLTRVDEDTVGPLDLLPVVESTLDLAAPYVDERAILVRDLGAVPMVRGTAARVGQVVLNLVSNALEAMPSTRDASENRLRVSVLPSSSGGAVIEVSDTGVGIPPEHSARIYEPFFSTKPSGTSTGLGLAISQRLVAEMGGELTFESAPGTGTTFRLHLEPSSTPGPT